MIQQNTIAKHRNTHPTKIHMQHIQRIRITTTTATRNDKCSFSIRSELAKYHIVLHHHDGLTNDRDFAARRVGIVDGWLVL